MVTTARVFRNGSSQAVRLPKEFRFDVDEVCIKRVGSAILLFPRNEAWRLFDSAIGAADDDFLPDRCQPPKNEKRKRL